MKDLSSALEHLLWYQLGISSTEQLRTLLKQSNVRNFDNHKLEKDLRLTVILHFLAKALPDLRFKWWTCLNKVYYPYFRLSEDLDFSIPINNELVNTNSKRKAFARHARETLKGMTHTMWWVLNDDKYHHKKALWNSELAKKNDTYLKYVISYTSIIDWSEQTIKVEITYSSKQ